MQKAHNSMKVKTVPSYLIAPSFRLKLSSSTGTYGAGRRLQGQAYVWQLRSGTACRQPGFCQEIATSFLGAIMPLPPSFLFREVICDSSPGRQQRAGG